MTPGFVIAILLCLGDNCDLVRFEPEVTYPSYETCSAATAQKGATLAETVARHREEGRESEIVCLRELSRLGTPAPAESAQRNQNTVAVLPPAKPQIGSPRAKEFRDCEQCPLMVALPGGSFEMGSNADPSERPAHRVTVEAFAIGKYELTQAEWNLCAAAGACGFKPKNDGSAQRPMTNLSWDDSVEYVAWLSRTTGKPYRLPSEAEWEYAARAGTATRYYWGNEVGVGRADCQGCGGAYDAHAPNMIGSSAANGWGLFDMLGSVAEWTEDCWHKSYNGAPTNGQVWRANPCSAHVLRGGSWLNPPGDLTVSSRNYYDTSVRYLANGMRVALSLK